MFDKKVKFNTAEGEKLQVVLLNKRKPLTLELARLFHREFHIPAEILLS